MNRPDDSKNNHSGGWHRRSRGLPRRCRHSAMKFEPPTRPSPTLNPPKVGDQPVVDRLRRQAMLYLQAIVAIGTAIQNSDRLVGICIGLED